MNKDIGYDIYIDYDKCSFCGACVDVCAEEVFELKKDHVKVIPGKSCQVCGHCISACKWDAIEHELLPLTECPLLEKEGQLELEHVVTSFRARRSVRNYSSKPVDRSIIEELISISRWVPSSQNKQPVDWLVFDKPDDISYLSRRTAKVLYEKGKLIQNPILKPFVRMTLGKAKFEEAQKSAKSFADLHDRQKRGQDPIFYNAPVVLVAYTPNSYFGRDDSIYALYTMMLAADQMGLGSCQIGYFIVALDNDPKFKKELKLAEDHIPQAAAILGYPRYEFYRGVPRRAPNAKWNTAKKED